MIEDRFLHWDDFYNWSYCTYKGPRGHFQQAVLYRLDVMLRPIGHVQSYPGSNPVWIAINERQPKGDNLSEVFCTLLGAFMTLDDAKQAVANFVSTEAAKAARANADSVPAESINP